MNIVKSVSKSVDVNGKYIVYEYHITKSENHIDGIGICTVYGIIIKSDSTHDSNHIQDISPNFEIVEALFEIVTCLNISPIHLNDVVEDYIIYN